VSVHWQVHDDVLRLEVLDSGPGVAGSDNLFVPFFTTKPGGTGIGLVLCRQIAEAHDGTLVLENREDGPGCAARLELPVSAAADALK
jgi:signal transduction histidine kinase